MNLIIPGWDEHFENNRSREYQHLRWVPMPNKHDGEGYAELLLGDEKGLEDFACWILIVQVASKCAPRGELLKSSGEPHTTLSLQLKTRAPASAFAHAVPRLLKIGWLKDLDPISQGAAEISQPPALNRIEKKRIEEKEENRTAVASRTAGYPDWFEELWNHYPRKLGKKAGYEACKTRVKQGANERDLVYASVNYAQSVDGREMAHIKHASSFFGPKDWWYDYKDEVPEIGSTAADGTDTLKKAFRDAPWNKMQEGDA